MSEYFKGKSDKSNQSPGSVSEEEIKQLKLEQEKVKDRILMINKNLTMELESYAKNRNENLKKILSYACYAEREKAKNIGEFASDRQKEYPVIDFSEPIHEEPPREEQKKEEDFDDL